MKERLALAALILAFLATSATAQVQVLAVNDDGTFNNGVALGFPVAQAAFKGTTQAPLTIVGAEIFTGESSGTMQLQLWSHDPATNHPGNALGPAGSWTMLRVDCWQGVLFPQPIALAAGQEFWLVWTTTMFCQASFSTAAANVDYCYSANGGVSWQQSAPGVNYSQPCKYRLYGPGPTAGSVISYGTGKAGTNGLIPTAGASGWPVRGNSLDLYCDLTARNAPALLLIGSAVNVPLGFGTLLVQPILGLSFTTGWISTPSPISGYIAVTTPIPQDASLQGLPVSVQWWFVDAGATSGLSHSDGLTITIG